MEGFRSQNDGDGLSPDRDGAPRDGAPQALGARRKGAERRVVTVMFADLVDSTRLFEGHDLEVAYDLLRRLLDAMAECVARYNGTVSQEMGDGVMCLFGAPLAEEDHATRAAMAAMDMIAMAEAHERHGLPPFQLRVGIDTGEVLIHPVENGLRRDLRTPGLPAHRAKKMQQRAPINGTVASETTHALIREVCVCERWDAQGDRDGHGPAWRVMEAGAGRRGARDLMSSDGGGPLFGRRDELARMRRAAVTMTETEGATFVITGDPGIGKSRLLAEFLRSPELSGWSVCQWPQSRVRRLETVGDLEVLAEQLAASAGHPDAVCEAAELAAGGLPRAALEECYHLPVTDPRWGGLDAAQRRSFLFEGLAAAIKELSISRPLALVVEDAQWSSGDTLKLLGEVRANEEESRTLLVTTWREEAAEEAIDIFRPALALRLRPLGEEDALRFLDHWLGEAPEVAEIKRAVAGRSEGVPLYLEESIRQLETDGLIVGRPGAYVLGDTDRPLRLPSSIRGLIESRIGSLAEGERLTLLQAAAIGPSIHLAILFNLYAGRREIIRSALKRLAAGGFLMEPPNSDDAACAFRHGLYQEVAYGMMAQEGRRVLHARILATLRRAVARDLPGRVELMAHHAARAADWRSAYLYSRMAGRDAERRCRHGAAEEHYADSRSALERLEPSRRNVQRRIDLLIAQPLVLLPQGGRGADDLLERARELADGIGDTRRHATASSILGSFQWVYGDIDDAIILARGALSQLDGPGGESAEISIRIRLGGMLADKGSYIEAAEQLRRGLVLCEHAIGDRRHGKTLYADVAAAAYLAPVLCELEGPERGIAIARKALAWSEEQPHLFSQVVSHLFLGRALLTADADAEAAHHFKASVGLAESIRCLVFAPLAMAGHGLALARTGNEIGARHMLAASARYAELRKLRRQSARIALWSAQAELASRDYGAALREAVRCQAIAKSESQIGDFVEALLTEAQARLHLEDRDTATRCAADAANIALKIGAMRTHTTAIGLGLGAREA